MSKPDPKPSLPRSVLDDAAMLVERAMKAGADAAEAVVLEGQSLGVSWRMGKLEDVERSEGRDVGLRVFIGKRNATVSTTDLSERSLVPLIERVVSMARIAPEDPQTPDAVNLLLEAYAIACAEGGDIAEA